MKEIEVKIKFRGTLLNKKDKCAIEVGLVKSVTNLNQLSTNHFGKMGGFNTFSFDVLGTNEDLKVQEIRLEIKDLYRVKLKNGEYLSTGDIDSVLTKGEAIKKAKKFDGKIDLLK